MRFVAVVGAVLAALAVQYLVLIRPWFQTWGATVAEMRARLPGDELWPDARLVETRAITVRAPAEKVWPWIAQLGQHRGGFHSYRLLEHLTGHEMPDTDRVLGLPDPVPGERFWLAPPHRHGGLARGTYALVDPGHAMVVVIGDLAGRRTTGTVRPGGTWAFVLEPAPDGATRLIVRGRSGHVSEPATVAGALFSSLVVEPAHFAMERKMMLGLRDRAEGRRPTPAWVDVTEVVLWIATSVLGVSAAIAILLRRRTYWKPLTAAAAALFVLTLLFFARPPLAVAIAVVALLRWLLSWAWKAPPAAASAHGT